MSPRDAALARPAARRARRPAQLVSRGAILLALVVLGALFAFPFFWQLVSSFKDLSEIQASPPRFIPARLRWENYTAVWKLVPFGRFTVNTLTVAILATVGQTLSAAAVAYGFARFRFRGREVLFALCLSSLMLPWEVTIVPQFIMFRELGWLDTLAPLIVPHWFGGGAFNIFLLRQFFLTIPRDLDEAAKIDGAGYGRIFWSILLPLSRPALITVAIFSFLAHWSEFITPLIYLNSTENFVLSLGVRHLQTLPTSEPARDHLLMAAATLVTLPPIVVFFALQRYFVRGVVMTGLKG
ncbi:MAG TPA: carbohydrate ABC transporter permease [Methylomirabilota bacterium]|jgi:multiple sugar transport system permease protein|nr:carbohydrate ABC transporter permease [Methylomirabilota bacterium]